MFQCQITVDNASIQQKNILPAPSTAETYSFSKIGNLPMDLFHGKANVNIPLYTITVDGIDIPIALSYNTGGIKLNEVASTVGLGWSLSIPGTIYQNIIGYDDAKVPFFNKNYRAYEIYNQTFDHNSEYNNIRDSLNSIYRGYYDTLPDLYDFGLPGISGRFILSGNQGMTIPDENIFITFQNGQNHQKKFVVNDTDGNQYSLSVKNHSLSYNPSEPAETSSSLYKLDSIRTRSNRVVSFYYEKNMVYTERNKLEKATVKITPLIDPGNTQYLPPPPYETVDTYTTNFENLITRIDFPEGSVEFLYSDDGDDLKVEGYAHRADLDSNNGVALRRVTVRNKSNTVISDYIFNYGYFSSDNSDKTFEDYRLKLESVYSVPLESQHKFTYNEEFGLPARNSNNDDYWGYINNLTNSYSDSNIPNVIHTDRNLFGISFSPKVKRRDRSPNPLYNQIGSLTSIEYPTGGTKRLYYETPVTEILNTNIYTLSDGTVRELISRPDPSDPLGGLFDDQSQTFSFTEQDIPYSEGAIPGSAKLSYVFGNTCMNADLIGDHHEVTDTSCYGNIRFSSDNNPNNHKNFTSNGQLFSGDLPMMDFPIRVELYLNRMGNCQCSVSASLNWQKSYAQTNNIKNYLSGLRIRRIEDVDENSVSNITEYKYGKYEQDNFKNISILKQPINFTRIDKKHIRFFSALGYEIPVEPPVYAEFLSLLNSGQAFNSYRSSDGVSYPFVIVENALGRTLYEFTDAAYSDQKLFTSSFERYNTWKYGLPLKIESQDYNGNIVKSVEYEYSFNNLKNSLSDFVNEQESEIAFAADMEIIPSRRKLFQTIEDGSTEVEIYFVKTSLHPVESGKIEISKITTKEFRESKILKTVETRNYYDNNINEPINIKSTKLKFPNNSSVETTYSYAHEKSNHYLIGKNMVGIPLETKVVLKQNEQDASKVISSRETLYPTSQQQASSMTKGLPLPYAERALELESALMKDELTYDRYDDKGNLLQYTTKAGISTAIVWGYNKTHPIAKIEGAKLSDIPGSLITELQDASDYGSAGYSENILIAKLDDLRKSYPQFRITTYTYQPLVGVTSITPPSGLREVYEYDSAGRLQSVKDHNARELKKYEYHYKTP